MQASSPPNRAVLLDRRYEVMRRIGSGTQSEVFLVRDLASGEERALKVAGRGLERSQERRFLREARLMKRLQPHPNVLLVHEVLDLAGSPGIVCELAPGGSVADWMHRNGRLPARLALRVALQCASALAHAHAAGVLHRDVKPGNMLLRADGTVVLADFGVASSSDEGEDDPSAVGTLGFMAPEQHRGGREATDDRADVYALGVALHRMCTGRRLLALFRCVPRPELLADLAPEVAVIVRACCPYDPKERPSMSEVRSMLVSALQGCAASPVGTPPLCEPSHSLATFDPTDEDVERLRTRLATCGGSEDATTEPRYTAMLPEAPIAPVGAEVPWPSAQWRFAAVAAVLAALFAVVVLGSLGADP